MKIYFEDGPLFTDCKSPPHHDERISATAGYSSNLADFEYWKKCWYPVAIWTNSLIALNNDYVWNDELGVPELYLRIDQTTWRRVDKMTDKEIHKSHNLMKMFMSGAFRKELK